MGTRAEPGKSAFSRDEDENYAQEISLESFEQDWESGGAVVVQISRTSHVEDGPMLRGPSTPPTSEVPACRAVLGGYDLFFTAQGLEFPAEVVAADMSGVVLFDVEVRKDDTFLVREGSTPYLGKSFRVERVRYFPRSKRAVCAAKLVG